MVGVPIDPLYVKFRDGLMKANDDVRDALRWRWSPRHGDWFQYSVAEWILDDVAIPDTSPGSSFHLTQEDEERVGRARADSFYPDVFARVQQRYARYKDRWPGLVWSWHGGGDWRNSLQRATSAPMPPPAPGPGNPSRPEPLPPECEKRIADVRAYAAKGYITAGQAEKMINEIVADCTEAD